MSKQVDKALEAKLAERVCVPVAYLFTDDAGRTKIVLGKETAELWCPPGETITPLYTAPQPAQDVAGLPFVRKILEKLERFRECAEDDEGVDIGRHWLDVLTRLGLLNRVQRSPARWEMTAQADDALEAAHQQRGEQPHDSE